jgi:tRNA A-37 threonylcarbamoyl transferase component Bud32
MHNFHMEGFVHGDLRAANILCREDSVMVKMGRSSILQQTSTTSYGRVGCSMT